MLSHSITTYDFDDILLSGCLQHLQMNLSYNFFFRSYVSTMNMRYWVENLTMTDKNMKLCYKRTHHNFLTIPANTDCCCLDHNKNTNLCWALVVMHNIPRCFTLYLKDTIKKYQIPSHLIRTALTGDMLLEQ